METSLEEIEIEIQKLNEEMEQNEEELCELLSQVKDNNLFFSKYATYELFCQTNNINEILINKQNNRKKLLNNQSQSNVKRKINNISRDERVEWVRNTYGHLFINNSIGFNSKLNKLLNLN